MTDTKQCLNCGSEYEPEYYELLGARLLIGQGLCLDCRKRKREEEEAKEKAAEVARIMGDRRRARERCGIPLKFMNQDFSTFEKGWQDRAFSLCWKYAEGFPANKRPMGHPSLFIYGNWGVGKTHLSCAIAHRIFDRWQGGERRYPSIRFVSEPDLFRKIQATYSFNREEREIRESEDDIIERISHCDLLILDDVGKERRQDPRFIQRTLFTIIDNRYKSQLPMIITANFDADGLRAHLEDASFDRFFEMTKGSYVKMDGESYRRK